MRFALALLVACLHLSYILPDGSGAYFSQAEPLRIGVTTFFIISGYSVAASYFRDPAGFLRRRAWRILPVYYTGIALSLLPWWLWGPRISIDFGISYNFPSISSTLKYLLMLQPAFDPTPDFNCSLWSLPVEVACYIAAPFVMRRNRLAISVFVFSAITYTFGTLHFIHHQNLILFAAMPWAFVAGWWLYENPTSRIVRGVVQLSPPVFLGLVFLKSGATNWWVLVLSVGLSCLIVNQNHLELSPRLQRLGTYLGDLSYPLYVLHAPVGWLLQLSGHALTFGPALLASLIVSVVTLHCIDRPLRRLGRRQREPKAVVQREAATAL